MKTLLIIPFFALLGLTVSCGNQNDTDKKLENIEIKVVNEAGLMVPAQSEIDSTSPPIISFLENTIDFGTITEGDVIYKVFKFKNTGETPLIITDAKASCGCTVPQIPEYPILPGEIGELKVKFDSKNKKGEISKQIRIAANTFPQRVNSVELKGKVNQKDV